MEHWLAEETLVFLRACLLGVALGVGYDVLRILRIAIPFHTVLVFIQDFLYFVLSAFVTFAFLLAFNDGQLRVYILMGELSGFIVYFFTIGLLLMKLSRLIIRVIKRVLYFILFPFRWLLCKVFIFFHWIFKKVEIKTKKLSGNLFLRLKNTIRLVYNRTRLKKQKELSQTEETACRHSIDQL